MGGPFAGVPADGVAVPAAERASFGRQAFCAGRYGGCRPGVRSGIGEGTASG